MKTFTVPAAAAMLLIICSACCGEKKASDYVNPFIGASTSTDLAGIYHGLGKTFPGATTPWGMVQVSPNTITGGDNGPGYSYEHETLEGFAFTQMSGIGWYGDFGNFPVMPTTGQMYTTAGLPDGSVKGWRSRFDKSSETASAGYYSAFLTDYGIRAEASAAPHSGILQFTFPEGEDSRIQIDLARRVGGSSTYQNVEVVDDRTIEGWMYCPPQGSGWGHGDGRADYTVYFHARFSRPFTDYGFWSADIPAGMEFHHDEMVSPEFLSKVADATVITGKDSLDGTHIGFFTQFPTGKDGKIDLRVGISYVDIEGARNNLESGIGERTSALGIDLELGYNPESISTTLEDGYGDWCLGRFADMTGHQEKASFYYEKSKAYRKIFDPDVKWFRPRREDGTWEDWPENGRIEDDYGCVESNPYQQGWFVPHDINGLAELLGGREAALKDLTAFFDAAPDDFHWNSYYNHANEPVHHIPFMFNRLGAPWLTQKWTRRICSNAYRNCVEGLVGNEDCGQMSAWYVLAACGIHPVCPRETLKYQPTLIS